MTDGYASPASPEELQRWRSDISSWLESELVGQPMVVAVDEDRSDGQQRWLIRVQGEEKANFAIWFHLRQRTLCAETYFMPAPEENAGLLYEHLLRRNLKLHRLRFAIGAEDAVFLLGELPLDELDAIPHAGLDWLFGSMYVTVEQCFRPAMRIGFASRFMS